MRVKRLDLFGFKSFSTKTTVHFEPGVTAIVGPNGSGKSNIVDSIRWVLGEHNPRDVRAPRLEDVIFNGTDTKAPLSMAEVSLMIDNDRGLLPIAFSEVVITRRVYRSGESEYCINQSPCRLKDIQELFLGTGLGGGTYAIIEQGHIDMILSSKPEERRGVFEEASGVAKYLSKKQETIRRLDEVEQHLTRIADIITEVRRQLNALERQAAKARQYKTQWEQLKHWELRLAANELRQGEAANQQLQQAVETLTQQRQTMEQDKQQLLTSLEACNATVTKTQTELQELRGRVIASASHIEQHAGQLSLKTRWIEELARQREQLLVDEAHLAQRLTQVVQQRDALSTQHAALDQQRQDALTRQAQTSEEQTTLARRLTEELRTLEQLKAELFEAAAGASQHRNALAGTTARLQTLQAQLARTAEQQQTLRARLEDLASRQQQLERERMSLSEQQRALQEQAATAHQSLGQAQGERHELLGRLNELRERAVSQRAKAQLLEEVWRRYEGFPDAVKALLANPPAGTLGLLADLLEPVPGYEHALEAALGALASAVVVRDRAALRRCHAYLADQQLEWAQVVVLSDCPQHPAHASTSADEGAVGNLQQFVRYDAAYGPLVAWLLGSWTVVDRIARVMDRTAAGPGRWVTQAGEWWDGQSWQLVGNRSSQSARVGRKRRWEHAHEELTVLERDVAAAQEAWQRAEEQWQSLVVHEQRIREESEHLLPGASKLDAHLAQITHETKRIREELAALELEQQDLSSQSRELTEAEGRQRHAVAEAEARQQELEQRRKDAQTRHDQATQRVQQLTIMSAQLEASLASLTERQAASHARLAELQAEQVQVESQRDGKRVQAQELAEKTADLMTQLEDHRQQAAVLTQEHAELSAQADRVAQLMRQEELMRNQVLPKVLAVEQELLLLTQSLQQQESQLTERSFRRARVMERLHEVYHLGEDSVLAEQTSLSPLTEEERQSLAEQVDRLKAKLEAMGPVSLGSVEEYDQLKQRLDFLQTQQQDLVTSREDLRHSITQINRTARHQFRETFTKIQAEFKHYYTKLFGGGEADLILLDDDDVLESGIEIVARPPGKRLQSISLLSGGERALTAIALLFALFKVRPSPFCILDEIDAPLDEANIDRFTNVFEEFLSLSQFILITHNKKTITKADCLYGVTMEQPGISKIVSVKLTPSKPAPATPIEAPVPA